MTASLRLGTAAQNDVASIRDWYADSLPALDLRFQRELDRVFQQITDFPAGFPVVYKDVRRAILNRFPYAVFYHRRKDELFVLAITHHARDPLVWKNRR